MGYIDQPMPIDPLAKRFYVITTFGEVGPVGVHELPELIGQGRIQSADMVRSATGRPLGTVADVVEGRVLSSQMSPGTAGRSGEERRRRGSSGTIPLSSEPGERRPPVMIWVLGGILVLLIILLIASLGGSGGTGAPRSIQADKPELILVAGRVDERGVREILIRAVAPVETDVDVQVRREDPVAAVKLDPPGGLVTMRAGTHTVPLSLLPGSITGPQRVQVTLAEGAGYRIGTARSITVEMVPVRRPFSWDPPSIAWEPFAHTAPARFDGGNGWAAGWTGSGIRIEPEPFPALAAFPHLPSLLGHALIRRPGDKWDPPSRRLGQRIGDGVFWMSLRVQVLDLVPGKENWVGMALMDGWDWRWYIGAGLEPEGSLKWHTSPKRKEDESRGMRYLSQPGRVPGLLILRLAWVSSGIEASTWIDAPAGREPSREQGVHAQGITKFSFNAVSLCGGAGSAIRFADLRMGRTWQEVVPPAVPSAGVVAAPVPVAAITASSRRAQDPVIAWEPAADMPGVWRGSGEGWAGNWEGDGLAWHGGQLAPSARPGFMRALAQGGSELKIARVLRQRIDEGTVWMSFLARACTANRPDQQYAGLRFYDREHNNLSVAWNLIGNDQGHWSAMPRMREVRDQGELKVAVPCDPRQVHRVVVKLHLARDKSAWRLWLDAPSDREPEKARGVGREGMPAFGFDRIVLWAKAGTGLDVADLRLGRTWSEVLPP